MKPLYGSRIGIYLQFRRQVVNDLSLLTYCWPVWRQPQTEYKADDLALAQI